MKNNINIDVFLNLYISNITPLVFLSRIQSRSYKSQREKYYKNEAYLLVNINHELSEMRHFAVRTLSVLENFR